MKGLILIIDNHYFVLYNKRNFDIGHLSNKLELLFFCVL